jgi:hypothetical protein
LDQFGHEILPLTFLIVLIFFMYSIDDSQRYFA